ncbi:LacI family DNA-binding transcriptional regulator [Dysosmobacter sp.]|uniref:LacI family DNA-binding transcriptional regulator n=1 Tax=Dysosmobacter sp. TaxID=2591382 RepID=UPI002A995DF0|nr:LacI family DNA-binding transcriptional regulator [Dysosmobacter sp.]MDY5611714.1 LacI family DNA-binding transcriptional regulator [Dysosmobacter sp.]
MKKRATIKDVAALAGVSAATVSRALDDRPEISDETKERVRSACAQLGYVPNAAARGLAGHATNTIGLVLPDISNPYFSGMATAIEETAAAHGYRVFLSNSLRKEERELRAIENLMARQVDGILVNPVSPESHLRGREVLSGLPCVYLGANHDGNCSYVMTDNEAGAYAAARYLIRLGHRDILFLGGRTTSRTRERRIRGFRRALAEAGLEGRELPAPPDVTLMRQWSYETALELLKGSLPDAIFAYSDMTALKVMEAAEERGIRIPEDLSMVGYDNIAFGALPRIHLTTVSQHKYRQGQIAVERLLEKIGGSEAYTADILEPELIIRSTCVKKRT